MKNTTTRRNKIKNRQGTTAVEFALISPVLFLIVFAGIEFARANIVRQTAANASYAASRAVIVPGGTKEQAIQRAEQILSMAGISNAVITISPDTITQDTASITAAVSVPMNANSWGISLFMQNRSIEAETELITERVPLIQATALPSNNVPPPVEPDPPTDPEPDPETVPDTGTGRDSAPNTEPEPEPIPQLEPAPEPEPDPGPPEILL